MCVLILDLVSEPSFPESLLHIPSTLRNWHRKLTGVYWTPKPKVVPAVFGLSFRHVPRVKTRPGIVRDRNCVQSRRAPAVAPGEGRWASDSLGSPEVRTADANLLPPSRGS